MRELRKDSHGKQKIDNTDSWRNCVSSDKIAPENACGISIERRNYFKYEIFYSSEVSLVNVSGERNRKEQRKKLWKKNTHDNHLKIRKELI